jgi:hypothetical protein
VITSKSPVLPAAGYAVGKATKKKARAKKAKAKKPAKGKKAKKPCKYGARVGGYCPKKPKTFAGALRRDFKEGRTPLSEGSVSRAAAVKAAEAAAARAVRTAQMKIRRNPEAIEYIKENIPALSAVAAVLLLSYTVQRAFLRSEQNGLRLALADYNKMRGILLAQYKAKRLKMPPAVENALLKQLKNNQAKISRVFERGKSIPFSEY